jgi:hypothetical protein
MAKNCRIPGKTRIRQKSMEAPIPINDSLLLIERRCWRVRHIVRLVL